MIGSLRLTVPQIILSVAVAAVAVRLVVGRFAAIPHGLRRSIIETLDAIAFAAGLSLLIITFLVQAFYIPSSSMEPALHVNDRILVSKLSYRIGPIERGDVIVFHYPLNPGKDFVKRVVALPGETVGLRDGVISINGRRLREFYPTPQDPTSGGCASSYGPQRIPEEQLFVLGDNRCNSEDSRFFGFVPVRNVVGKAVLVYWPPTRLGVIH